MKKMAALALCLALVFSMVGCGAKTTGDAQGTITEESVVSQEVEAWKEPPALTVVFDAENSIEAWMGTYSWRYQNEDGTGMGTTADSAHPLEAKECIPYFTSPVSPTVYLQWDAAPDRVSVRFWDESGWGRPDTESEELPVTQAPAPSVELKNGAYIYEVTAEWSSAEKYSGEAYYSFYTVQ